MPETFHEQPENLESQVDKKDIVETKKKYIFTGYGETFNKIHTGLETTKPEDKERVNQDSLYTKSGTTFLGDGMGGYGEGHIASGILVQEGRRQIPVLEQPVSTTKEKEASLKDILVSSNREIEKKQTEDKRFEKIATTAIAAQLYQMENGEVFLSVAESGDSPIVIINKRTGTIEFINQGSSMYVHGKADTITLEGGVPGYEGITEHGTAVAKINDQLAEYELINDAPEDLRFFYSPNAQGKANDGLGTKKPLVRTYSRKINPAEEIVLMGSDGSLQNLTKKQIREVVLEENSTEQIVKRLNAQALENARLAIDNPGIYTYKGNDDVTLNVLCATEALEAKYEGPDLESTEDRKDATPVPDLSDMKKEGQEPELIVEKQEKNLAPEAALNNIEAKALQEINSQLPNNEQLPPLTEEKKRGFWEKKLFGRSLKETAVDTALGFKGGFWGKLASGIIAGGVTSYIFREHGELGAVAASTLSAGIIAGAREGWRQRNEIRDNMDEGHWARKIEEWQTKAETLQNLSPQVKIQKLIGARAALKSIREEALKQNNFRKADNLERLLSQVNELGNTVDLSSSIALENKEKRGSVDELITLCQERSFAELEEIAKTNKEAAQVIKKVEQSQKAGYNIAKIAGSAAAGAIGGFIIGEATRGLIESFQGSHPLPETISTKGIHTELPSVGKGLDDSGWIKPEIIPSQPSSEIITAKSGDTITSLVKDQFAELGIKPTAEQVNQAMHETAYANSYNVSGAGETVYKGFASDTGLKVDANIDVSPVKAFAERIGLLKAEAAAQGITEKVSAITSKGVEKATEVSSEVATAIQAKVGGLMALATNPIKSIKDKAKAWFKW